MMVDDLERLAMDACERTFRVFDVDTFAAARLAALSCPSSCPRQVWYAARNGAVEYVRREIGRTGQRKTLSLEALRERGRAEGHDEDRFEPADLDWEGALDRLEGALIWHWLAPQLTVRERQVIRLWIWEGLSHGEIAGRLGISLSRVGQLAASALGHYRQRFGVTANRHGAIRSGLASSPTSRTSNFGLARYYRRHDGRPFRRTREENREYMREYRRRQKERTQC